jgi:hypothetical protein
MSSINCMFATLSLGGVRTGNPSVTAAAKARNWWE